MLIFIGCLFIGVAGALLHEVPLLRFLAAMMLLSAGQVFLTLGFK